MLLNKIIPLSLLLTLAFPAMATPNFIKAHITNAAEVGSARFSYLMWDVYDISLYTTDGTWNEAHPFALSLSYLRDLEGKAIAKRSIEEMRKIGFTDEVRLAAWLSEMQRIFPNVNKDIVLTGIYTPNSPTLFLRNGEVLGSIKDPEFGAWFFNIWLSPNTSQPTLRRKLLGLK